jgi:hypothetical protein
MSVDVNFALAALVCGFAGGLDSVITCYGITVAGFVEANPLYKILPTSVSNFILKSALGVFLFGGARVIGTGFAAMLLANHGFYTNTGSLFFWIPAAGLVALNIRNGLMILKAKKAVVAPAPVVAAKK